MSKKYKLELNSNEMCRSCLTRNCQLKTLFCNEIVDGEILPLPTVFENVTQLQIAENDGFPEKICINCLSKVIETFVFKQKCSKSAKLLRQILNLSEINAKSALSPVHKSEGTQTEPAITYDAEIQTSPLKCTSNKQTQCEDDPKSIPQYESFEYLMEEIPEISESNAFVDYPNTKIASGEEDGVMVLIDGIEEGSQITNDTDIEKSSRSKDAIIYVQIPLDTKVKSPEQRQTKKRSKSKSMPKQEPEPMCFVHCDAQKVHLTHLTAKITNWFKCEHCNEKFTNENEMKLHSNGHVDILPLLLRATNFFRCVRCRLVFPYVENLVKHFNQTNVCGDQAEFTAVDNNCADYQSVDEPVMNKVDHIRVFSCYINAENNAVCLCDVCDNPFDSVNDFVEHFDQTHLMDDEYNDYLYADVIERSHMCGICNKSYGNLNDILHHVYFHQSEYRCPNVDCSVNYQKFDDLHLHMVNDHAIEANQKCLYCKFVVQNKDDLKQHLKHECKARVYKCKYCEKSFFRKSTVVIHQRIHTNERRHKCGICDKAFRQSNDLTSHMRTHTLERPFKCDLCEKSFKTVGQRIGHMSTHTDEHNFECDICLKTFKSARILRGHSKLHAERKFDCKECGRKFSRRYHLTIHMRRHAKNSDDN